ncbi:MAG: DUF2608 domain-containing protein [Parachlamydia sp.]|jgi:FMN phosphatase YigB (HAD superfamily)|nr:DUF2608 domain-containing protein [Parachlamydia sp.]
MLIRISFLLLVYFSLLEARIIETRHIVDVLPHIVEDCWFLVDLDNCLFEGAQALGHANWFYDELQKRMEAGMARDEAIHDFYPHWIKTQALCKVKPIEEQFVTFLLQLQNKGITIMGLTHRQPLVADSTAKQVDSLGVNFLTTAPSQDAFALPTKTPTLYYKGILFVGDYNKKIDLFEKFLSKIGKKPRKIVFIDDKRKNVEELETLTLQGIEYTGIPGRFH